MPSQIFLSYRREDTSASAGRFHDHLCARFASDQVFMDVDTLEPGVDFVKAIEKSVEPLADAGERLRGISPRRRAAATRGPCVGLDLGNVVAGFNDGKVFTAPVGSFRPHDVGIYDLGGNVWEWCDDKYDAALAWRVLRGGSWVNSIRGNLLSSNRNCSDPDNRSDNIGFRCLVESGAR